MKSIPECLEEKYKKYKTLIEHIEQNTQSFSMEEVVKILNFKVGRNRFFKILLEDNILKKSWDFNIPYQRYIDLGYFEVKLVTSASGYHAIVTRVTTIGMAWIAKRYNKLIKKKIVTLAPKNVKQLKKRKK